MANEVASKATEEVVKIAAEDVGKTLSVKAIVDLKYVLIGAGGSALIALGLTAGVKAVVGAAKKFKARKKYTELKRKKDEDTVEAEVVEEAPEEPDEK